jgi:carbon monoxide dehydrogenase subunit G
VIIDQQVTLPAPADKVWDFMMDVPAVSTCVPGVESVSQVDGDTYTGALKVKVGPIGLRLEGQIVLAERDRDAWRARMDVQAADKRVSGAVSAKMTLQLVPQSPTETQLTIHTDANIMGKLGEFGQAVMRKKADQIMAEFARNMATAVGPQHVSK